MILTFGAGDLYAQMIQDAYGNKVTTPTPIRIAGLQEVSIDFAGELKEFFGQNRYALATAMGKVKTTGKIKGAIIDGQALNTLFFGDQMSTGAMKSVYADTAGQSISTSITITPAQGGTFAEDLGVVGGNGLTFIRVAGAPQAGQYAVTAQGVYTFNTADNGKTAYISYSYTYTLASAKKITLNNMAMGNTPIIKMLYASQFRGKRTLLELEAVTSNKLGLFSSKNDDFSVPELDFAASVDEAGYKLGTLYVQE